MSRDLRDLPLEFTLLNSIKGGSAPIGAAGSFKGQLAPTWRQSIRSVGGYHLATSTFDGPDYQKLDIFQGGLTWEVRVTLGGLIVWQGFIAEMTLTKDGHQYVRRWADLANRVQAIYTRLGDNLLTNGSAETGVWATLGTPTTLAQSGTWVSDGANSMHIITDAGSEGAIVQTGITIVAGKSYEAQFAVNIISGTWNMDVYRTDTNVALAIATENTAGQKIMRVTIPDTNTYAGTVGVRFYTPAIAPGEIYADGGSLREASVQARTNWLVEADSAADYGTLETSLLLAGMSDSAANAHAATYLAEHAWPGIIAPGDYGGGSPAGAGLQLDLTFCGYAFTLRNKYVSRAATTQNASVHVTNLIADSEFVTGGVIETNTMQWQLEDRAPLRVWEVLRDITRAGDTTGARWACGVYGGRLFNYGPADTAVSYHYRGGEVLNPAGGVLEPWLCAPGAYYFDDMPVGPGSLTVNARDDPHVLYVEECVFSVADWLGGQPGVSFKRQAGDE